jgi:predicted NBD/HSP70 family sugar kinase
VVIIGGGISQSHDILLQTTLQTLQQRSLQTIAPEVQVKKALYTNHAGIVGAAVLGKQQLEFL